jgi:hypothetical protein
LKPGGGGPTRRCGNVATAKVDGFFGPGLG